MDFTSSFRMVAVALCGLGCLVSSAFGQDSVTGSLSLYIHEFEDGADVEYCMLTPHDENTQPFVIETMGESDVFTKCYKGVSGSFNLIPASTGRYNKDGCDTKYLPLCVEASYLVDKVEVDEEATAQRKGAQDKISGSRSILLVQMVYQDKSPACDSSCVQQNFWGGSYNVDGLYNEASFGTLRFPQSSSKTVQLSMGTRVSDYAYCTSAGAPQKIYSDALAALSQQYPSVSTSSYNHFMMITPALCGVAVSQVGGSILWINSASPDVYAHELGHNLGRRHAAIDTTDTDPSSLASYPTDKDYGDLSCIMGYSGIGLRSFNVPNRISLGWIPSSAIVVPPAATCAGTSSQYTLASAQFSPGTSYGRHAIQIPRAEGGKYLISYRAGVGYDTNAPSGWKGVVFVHYVVSSTSRTKFVRALQSGSTFSDSVTSFAVRVVSMNSNSASVAVRCGAMDAGSCSLKVATSAQSSLTGTFSRTSNIGGYKAWARSDLRAIIAYCASQTVWVIGNHDGSAATNFKPCDNHLFKSATLSAGAPTNVESWVSCSSSSSCSQDTSASVTLNACTVPSNSPTRSRSRSPSPTRLYKAELASTSSSASHTPSPSPAHAPSSVCPYFSSLCTKCEMAPNGLCTYLEDLCAECQAE